jgi:hypothetical protein
MGCSKEDGAATGESLFVQSDAQEPIVISAL